MRAHSRFHWASKAHTGHGDAAQTSPLLRSYCCAGSLQSVRGMVQAGGRSQLLLRGQGVRFAVRDPEVTARQEGGKPVRQRRDGDQQRVVWSDFSQLHPQNHGMYYFFSITQLQTFSWRQLFFPLGENKQIVKLLAGFQKQRSCHFSTMCTLSILRLHN